jgi:hypothetical protein
MASGVRRLRTSGATPTTRRRRQEAEGRRSRDGGCRQSAAEHLVGADPVSSSTLSRVPHSFVNSARSLLAARPHQQQQQQPEHRRSTHTRSRRGVSPPPRTRCRGPTSPAGDRRSPWMDLLHRTTTTAVFLPPPSAPCRCERRCTASTPPRIPSPSRCPYRRVVPPPCTRSRSGRPAGFAPPRWLRLRMRCRRRPRCTTTSARHRRQRRTQPRAAPPLTCHHPSPPQLHQPVLPSKLEPAPDQERCSSVHRSSQRRAMTAVGRSRTACR